MFLLANLQKMNFMLDIITNSEATKCEAFCFTKWGKWYHKVGQVLQSDIIFITKWKEGLFQSRAIIAKKRRIVQSKTIVIAKSCAEM